MKQSRAQYSMRFYRLWPVAKALPKGARLVGRLERQHHGLRAVRIEIQRKPKSPRPRSPDRAAP
jgi:uncharacterized protein YbdZ (MbtH family)